MEKIQTGFYEFFQKKVLPTLRIEAKYSTSGKKLVCNAVVKYRGGGSIKVWGFDKPGRLEHTARYIAFSYIEPSLIRDHMGVVPVKNSEIDQAIGSIVANPVFLYICDEAMKNASNLEEARTTLVKNNKRFDSAARENAIRKISNFMRTYDFTKDEVMDAWSLSQVERIQNS